MAIKDNIEDFAAGDYQEGYDYKYFLPSMIDRPWEYRDGLLSELLEKASIKLGELNSFAKLVPNIEVFIQLHVTKEAVISSRIEGTQTTMNEALMPFEEIRPEKRDDWLEVQNYTRALNEAVAAIESDALPLSSRLLRDSHRILMQGVRGENKRPGEFRTSQNWIGGASLKDAAFIPPSHIHVPELMGDLEKFFHDRQIHVPSLIRIGIAHYQFETIHPFLDGNGRIGRLLITLYLVSEKILDRPILYPSIFFEKDKRLYYENLTKVREIGDLVGWLRYFLAGIEQTATRAVETLRAVMILKADMEVEIARNFGKRSSSAFILLNAMFGQPLLRRSDVRTITGLSKKAANDLVNLFCEREYLLEVSGNQRGQVFIFDRYVKLFE